MTGPRLVLRDVGAGASVVDLLFYDDVLAIAPGRWESSFRPHGVFFLLWRLSGRSWVDRNEPLERSPYTLRAGTRLLPYAQVASVRVEPGAYGAARLHLDGETFVVSKTNRYRKPWPDLLLPFFGDRVTVA